MNHVSLKGNNVQTVDFYPKEFRDIPEQDNPAFGGEECLMIVKEHNGTKACVLRIKPDPIESVNYIALFWRHDLAVEYSERFGPSNALLDA
jgi:hypothetical protein